jgi:adenine-specific DNA-methyltransferase
MVYVDPPYGIKFGSNWQVSARKRDVKDGKVEDASRQVEQIKAFRDTWELGINSYLTYLRDRLLAARDLLTESGSCFVQIGDENVHLVRSLMDEVFGSENFVAQVSFKTTTSAGSPSGGTDVLASIADFVIWYARNKPRIKYRQVYLAKRPGQAGATDYRYIESPEGERRAATSEELTGREALPAGSRLFTLDNLTSQSGVDKTRFPVALVGKEFTPGTAVWKTSESGMTNLIRASRVHPRENSLRYVRYLADFPVHAISNVWDDTIQGHGTDKVYVVQTFARVIERCMLMCTDPGDLVLDPTCGSGTTAYVAEQWGRRWITVDTSRVALALARQRLMGAKFPYYLLADSAEGRLKEGQLTGTALPDSSPTDDIRHGFVYERVQHITLKSIANNPDIREGMSREEIDTAIKRHADFELLYDKPYEDKGKVRVTGPFTVESLSPHRSLAFAGGPEGDPNRSESEKAADEDPTGADFTQTILDNLLKAGIQNGRRAERIELETIEPYAGTAIHAVATRLDRTDSEEGAETEATPARIGISLGPQYGTVGGQFVKTAAREAINAGDIDLLCVLAFAFDPGVVGTTVDGADVAVDLDDDFASVAAERKLGRVPVLLVRMNADLVMGEELKKTGAGNLFTVFGEPDIEIRPAPAGASASSGAGEIEVELHGVDVYDPTTGEVRSRDTDRIALWMIDTDYDGESFFVRHAYFTGGQDPYTKHKRDLRAEIDEKPGPPSTRRSAAPSPPPPAERSP